MPRKMDEIQKLGQDNFEFSIRRFGVMSDSIQAISTEVSGYSRRSLEDSSQMVQSLLGAKTLSSALEIQSIYFKTACQEFFTHAIKLNELYVDLARETAKPYPHQKSEASAA